MTSYFEHFGDLFRKATQPFEVVSSEVERHGSVEWTAARTEGFTRFVTLALTELSPVVESDPWYGPWFSVEVWAGGDDDRSYTRNLLFHYNAPAMSLKNAWDRLSDNLHQAVEFSNKLTERDLSEAKVQSRVVA